MLQMCKKMENTQITSFTMEMNRIIDEKALMKL